MVGLSCLYGNGSSRPWEDGFAMPNDLGTAFAAMFILTALIREFRAAVNFKITTYPLCGILA